MYDLSQLSNDYIIPSCQNDLKLNCAQFHRAELGDFVTSEATPFVGRSAFGRFTFWFIYIYICYYITV